MRIFRAASKNGEKGNGESRIIRASGKKKTAEDPKNEKDPRIKSADFPRKNRGEC